jgi:hypothetical protein
MAGGGRATSEGGPPAAVAGQAGDFGRAIRYNACRMSGGTTTIILILVAGLGLTALAAVLRAAIRNRRRGRRQGRLERGFERAREVARSGSGIQGTPYSVYGEAAWSDDTRDRD